MIQSILTTQSRATTELSIRKVLEFQQVSIMISELHETYIFQALIHK